MGISNELFQNERDETANCMFASHPNSITNTEAAATTDALSAIEKFAFFMRLLAPPAPSPDTPGGAPSIGSGKNVFNSVGCAFCHTPSFTTGNSAVAALRNQQVRLYSDLLVHDMGLGLPTVSVRARRARGNSGPRRSGGSVSGSSSCTMAGRRIWRRRSARIRASGRRPTGSSRTSWA